MDYTKITTEEVASSSTLREALERRMKENTAAIVKAEAENRTLERLLERAAQTSEVFDGMALSVRRLESGNWAVHTADPYWHGSSVSGTSAHALVYRHRLSGEWILRKHGPGLNAGGQIHSTSWTDVAPALEAAKSFVVRTVRNVT